MVLGSKQISKIWEALDAQPAKLIRIAMSDQKTAITAWNPSKMSTKDFFDNVMKPWLMSDSTGGGRFVIQGRLSTQSKPITLLEIDKEGPELKESPIQPSADESRLKANATLLSENADYKYKCLYQEKEIENLKIRIEELEADNLKLIQEVEELETEKEEHLLEEEENKTPELTQTQQVLLSAAAPLIPKVVSALGLILDRFLPQDPNNQVQPQQKEGQVQYPINFQEPAHHNNG